MMPIRRFLRGKIACSALALIAGTVPARAQTVCLGRGADAECQAAQKRLCANEPGPPNLSVAHSVRLSGVFVDPTGAPINFDAIKPEHRTIVQIKSLTSGEILFAVPLRPTGEFEFELVPEGTYRLIVVWMKDGAFKRLPLADQPKEVRCSDLKECRIGSAISFHGTDNPIDFCPPK